LRHFHFGVGALIVEFVADGGRLLQPVDIESFLIVERLQQDPAADFLRVIADGRENIEQDLVEFRRLQPALFVEAGDINDARE
jgi:hypothetical protein